ncbi:mucoidy inhibitor MuiA family protein [Gimibacter soli]|uniref:Mucoidy inhibitor MuiA family protein n=1 Tax=Gimibacter soli TaxID=3024400 RepID=A0AAF0BKV4_9PROT|nr:mucoidy inhibitor MuiA family protein [Gimibacter soli]WCL52740.1 mucoidy inhibitor MuiA family protein [Gimibacter soli]
MSRSFATLLAATVLTAPAFADTASTRLDHATVYVYGGVDATRVGSVNVPAGDHEIVIRDLPARLAENPAFVRATLGRDVVLTDLRVRTADETDNPNPRLKTLEDQIDALQAEIDGHNDTIRGIDIQLGLLGNTGGLAGDPKGWGAALKFAGEQTETLIAARRMEEKAIDGIMPAMNALQAELNRAGGQVRRSAEVILSVHSPKAVTAPLSLSYFLNEASWRPKVESYLDSATGKVAIHYVGEISQSTGEDWQGVKVDLAVHRPSGYFGNADLSPSYVGLEVPRPTATFAMAAPMQAESARMRKGQMADVADLQMTAFDRRYALKDALSLPSGGDEQRFDLEVVDEKAEFVVRAIPSQNPTAFVFADLTWSGKTTLNNVTARLIRDGNFVGEGQWPNLVPDEKVELPYGEDPLVTVEYVREAEKDKEGGLFRGKSGDESRHLINVKNNHDRPTTVEIIDRVPVSTHEDVKVEIAKDATPATSKGGEDEPGILKWKKTLQPGESWTIRHGYRISYPDGKQISRSY